jgi:hypothetical protein
MSESEDKEVERASTGLTSFLGGFLKGRKNPEPGESTSGSGSEQPRSVENPVVPVDPVVPVTEVAVEAEPSADEESDEEEEEESEAEKARRKRERKERKERKAKEKKERDKTKSKHKGKPKDKDKMVDEGTNNPSGGATGGGPSGGNVDPVSRVAPEAGQIFLDPTVSELRAYTKALTGGENRNLSGKVIAKIPKFSGEDVKYTWPQFAMQIEIACMNQSYDDGELKMILLQALEGAAFQYLNAHRELLEKDFGFIMQHLEGVYGHKPQQDIAKLRSLVQEPRETVRNFSTRVLNNTNALRPQKPYAAKVTVENGVRIVQQNPLLDIEMQKYDAQIQQLNTFLLAYFLQGLRPDIRRTMKVEMYSEFEVAVKAAEDAEYFLEATGMQMSLHNINLEPAENSVNFVQYNPLKEMDKRPVPAQKRRHDVMNVKCFKCGRKGHMQKTCWVKVPDRNKNRNSRFDRRRPSFGRSPSRNRSRSRSRNRNADTNSVNSLAEQMGEMMINMISRSSRKDIPKNVNIAKDYRSRSPFNRTSSRSHSRSRSRTPTGSRRGILKPKNLK